MERTCGSAANCCSRFAVRSATLRCLLGAHCASHSEAATVARCDRFIEMDLLTLTDIRRTVSRASGSAAPARVHVQVESATAKTQRDGKPYCELILADACDR